MFSSVENKALLVSLIGIDQRNRNVIEMVFNKMKSGPCIIAHAEQASVTIVDLDKYGATDEWLALQQIKPEQLAIFLSINEAQQNLSHPVLKKPVLINQLMNALNEVRDQLGINTFSEQTKQYSSLKKLFSPRLKHPSNNLTRVTKDYDSEDDLKEIHFLSEHGYLIDEVKRSVVQANSEGHGIKLQIGNQGSIFIDPSEHWINTDLEPAALEDLCQHSLNESDVVKRIFNDREFSKYLDEWQDTKLKPIDIDSFLWDLALWTYKGSIPSSTDLNQKISLTYWPDLPKLTPIPNAMRIAALWISCPITLLETIDVLKIEQEDVFNFYTAVSTLGLIRQGDQLTKRTASENHYNKPASKSKKSQQEFFLRILKYLKGHDLDE